MPAVHLCLHWKQELLIITLMLPLCQNVKQISDITAHRMKLLLVNLKISQATSKLLAKWRVLAQICWNEQIMKVEMAKAPPCVSRFYRCSSVANTTNVQSKSKTIQLKSKSSGLSAVTNTQWCSWIGRSYHLVLKWGHVWMWEQISTQHLSFPSSKYPSDPSLYFSFYDFFSKCFIVL